MLDYPERIQTYLSSTFTPSDPDRCDVKHTTMSLLHFLFKVFPKDCISDYELVAILESLGYQIHNWLEEQVEEEIVKGPDKTKKTIYHIHKQLTFGWCMKSEFNLKTETITDRTSNDDTRMDR